METQPDNLWGERIFSYTRAQAIADGVLVDLTTAAEDVHNGYFSIDKKKMVNKMVMAQKTE